MNVDHSDDDDMTSQLEFGWRAHSAQEAWTAKVDVKASVLLAAQVGLLVVIATLVATDAFHSPACPANLLLPVGTLLIIAAGVVSGWAVYPQLSTTKATSTDLIYFGHLKDMDPTEVSDRLKRITENDQLGALSRQLVRMSQINWAKHRRLQISIWITGSGGVLSAIGLIYSLS